MPRRAARLHGNAALAGGHRERARLDACEPLRRIHGAITTTGGTGKSARPLRLTDICVLLYDQLTPTQRTQLHERRGNFQPPTPDMTQATTNALESPHRGRARLRGERCSAKTRCSARDAFSDRLSLCHHGRRLLSPTAASSSMTNHPYTAGLWQRRSSASWHPF